MLIVYCLKDVSFTSGSRGIPEGISILVTILLHRLRGNMLISIAGGSLCYMLLIRLM